MGEFSALLPAAILTAGILAVLGVDLLARGRRPGLLAALAVMAFLGAGAAAALLPRREAVVLGALRADLFGVVFTAFCCGTGALSVLALLRGEAFRRPGGEVLTLFLSSVLGMGLLSMAVDMVTLYLAFETVSIPAYVLVGMRRGDVRANEAGMKYVLFGAVSSALMLYGLSLLVGLAGSTTLEALRVAIENGAGSQPAFFAACTLVLCGFAFKISAVPFHFWAPDVYAGAPAAVGGFLAVASKAAGFAALVRVMIALAPEVAPGDVSVLLPRGGVFVQMLAVLAILSQTIGNLAALRQKEIKRLLAWSSVAHAGFILLALSVWSEMAMAALLLYLVAYLFMNLAAFFVAGIVIRELGTGEIRAFRGLWRRNVLLALSMAVALFSLTGLPPFFGFVAKLQLFYAVFEKEYVWLGVIGLINGVISLAYYARVVASMWPFDASAASEAPPCRLTTADRALCLALSVPILLFGVWWDPIWVWATEAVPAALRGL